jgi:anthranilate synthase component 2
MILLVDNYDSFSYNLYQLIGGIQPDIKVARNDSIDVDGIRRLAPTHIVFSPGPGRPADAGVCEEAIAELAGQIPMLGVCLGHQAICEVFGGLVSYAKTLMHGKSCKIELAADCPLFAGMPRVISAARYHSLSLAEETLPSALRIVSRAQDGEVMGVCHRESHVYGVQFHPESVLTPEGGKIIRNFLSLSA